MCSCQTFGRSVAFVRLSAACYISPSTHMIVSKRGVRFFRFRKFLVRIYSFPRFPPPYRGAGKLPRKKIYYIGGRAERGFSKSFRGKICRHQNANPASSRRLYSSSDIVGGNGYPSGVTSTTSRWRWSKNLRNTGVPNRASLTCRSSSVS